jgi:hypothetical protein
VRHLRRHPLLVRGVRVREVGTATPGKSVSVTVFPDRGIRPEQLNQPEARNSDMARGNGTRGLRETDFWVSPDDRPGWVRASERTPQVGENVYCAGGEGTMVALHGKTSDGSRLLEIRFTDRKAPPFFAAASNVLVSPALV